MIGKNSKDQYFVMEGFGPIDIVVIKGGECFYTDINRMGWTMKSFYPYKHFANSPYWRKIKKEELALLV